MTKKLKRENNPFERLQPLSDDFFNVPLLGMVRPDNTHLAHGDYDLGDLVSNFRNNTDPVITLEVLDNAMFHAGILKGDFLTVNLAKPPREGDIAVVKLGERIYVRKFFRQGQLIRLETADDYPTPLVIEQKTPGFEILGKVQSVLRRF